MHCIVKGNPCSDGADNIIHDDQTKGEGEMTNNRLLIVEDTEHKTTYKKYRLNYPFGRKSQPTKTFICKWCYNKDRPKRERPMNRYRYRRYSSWYESNNY